MTGRLLCGNVMGNKDTYKKGLISEYWAAIYLFLKGYRIIKMRYKTSVGEIDIIASKRNALIFIEVKNRALLSDGLYAITPKGQHRIRRAAEYYLMQNHKESPKVFEEIRCDVIIVMSAFRIKHISNSF